MEISKEGFHWIIFHNFRRGLSQQECVDKLNSLYGDKVSSKTTVYRWYCEFNRGRSPVADEFREGRSKSVVVAQNIDAMHELIIQDCHVTYREIEASLHPSSTSIHSILHEHLVIKFHDFYIPTDNRNSSECNLSDSLQLLTKKDGKGKEEITEIFCGAFIPKPIMSDGPTLFLQFTGKLPPAETRLTYYGFKAEYKFLTNFGVTTGKQLDNNCTFAYNSTERKSGSFYSPNFPGIYPKGIVCNYYFYGEPNEKVVLHFTYFDVEGVGNCEELTASDFVEFSNFITTDRKFRRYCGKRDRFQMRSDTRFFRVTLYTNDRFDKTGFRALYDFESVHIPSENTSMQSYVSNKSTKMFLINLYFFALLNLEFLLY